MENRKRKVYLHQGRLAVFLDFLSRLAILASLVIAGLQYFAYQQDMQIQRTLNFVERFQDGPVGQAQRGLTTALRQVEPAVQDIKTSGLEGLGANAAYTEIRRFVIYESNNGQGVWRDVDTVVLFLEELEVCVETGLCDERVAIQFFADYAEIFVANFEPYLDDRSAMAPDFGQKVRAFANRKNHAQKN